LHEQKLVGIFFFLPEPCDCGIDEFRESAEANKKNQNQDKKKKKKKGGKKQKQCPKLSLTIDRVGHTPVCTFPFTLFELDYSEHLNVQNSQVLQDSF
jgi:hypothetical protein